MENKYYPLEIGKDTVINLFDYPAFGIDGNNRKVFIKHLVKAAGEYSPVVLDRDGLLTPLSGCEYVSGERETLERLRELSKDEVVRRGGALSKSQTKNFFLHNSKVNEEDRLTPHLVIYVSRNLTDAAQKELFNLTVFARMSGLFPVWCYPEDEKVRQDLLGSTYLYIHSNRGECYMEELFKRTTLTF